METDVLVIGGGATGVGIAWDLSLRGVRTVLVEMGDLATGTSGRYHGLLHSGGRYAVRDTESAKECIDENTILRHIVPQVLEDTGGLFVLCPGDDESFVDQWVAGCKLAGIPTNEITPAAALKREPVLNPGIRRAFEVPDGSCDSWDLVHSLRHAAEENGAKFLTYHRVDDLQMTDNRVTGVTVTDLREDRTFDLNCAVVVIAAGPWSARLAAKAGVHFNLKLSRGAMLAFNVRWVNTVVNKLRTPGDGDIFVPVGTVSVTGTTSVSTDDPADMRIDRAEVQRILDETEGLVPGISQARILRCWAGVRPLYDPGEGSTGRGAKRTFDVLDHAEKEGVEGLVTIVGGKLTTFRLMAERTADVVCRKLGVDAACTTATTVLPAAHKDKGSRYHQLRGRLNALEHGQMPGSLICECEMVTAPQIVAALKTGEVVNLNDIRRDLRVGMGPCQGGFCAFRTAALRHETLNDSPENTLNLLSEFVGRRFGGVKPLLWGHNLRQALLAEHIYQRIVGLGNKPPKQHHRDMLRNITVSRDGEGQRVVVVGAGLSGLMAALTAAESGAKVQLVAQGQGGVAVYPGWLEVGDVEALAKQTDHPYHLAGDSLSMGLGLLNQVLGITQSAVDGVLATGKSRQVAYGIGGSLPTLSPSDQIVIVGIKGWRDFYPQLVADNLKAQGYNNVRAVTVDLPQTGNFDNWPIDIANRLDKPDGLKVLVDQVRPQLDWATVIGFPAVLGFLPETRKQLAEALACGLFEIPTLPPSIPGMRLFRGLLKALRERGVRIVIGPRVTGLAMEADRVTGVKIEMANKRTRTLTGDAVILCTGGLLGGGLESDYQGQVCEPIVDLPVVNVPPVEEWFTADFLSGEAQPVHRIGVVTDANLHPLDAAGKPVAANLFAAGRLLANYSPVAEGSTEGVDIATGVFAARQAIRPSR